MTLRTKLLLYILAPIFCAVSIIVYVEYVQTKAATLSHAKTNLRTSANFITENISAEFKDVRSSLHLLSDKLAIKDIFGTDQAQSDEIKTLQAYFLKTRDLFPLADDIFLLDNKGNIIASTNPKDYGKNYGDRQYFTHAQQGHFVVSHTLISRATNKETIFISIPVCIDDIVSGVLVVCIVVEKILDACFQKIHLNSEMQFLLLDTTNNSNSIIARMNNSTALYPVQGLNITDVFAKQTQDFFVFTSDTGIQYTGYYQKILFNDWVAVVMVADRELFAPLYTTTLHSATILLFIMLCAVLIIIFIVSSMTTSLNKGLTFAQAVAAGNFDERLEEYRNDELGQLYNALRAMMQTIQQTKNVLQSVLEEKSHQLSATQEHLIRESVLNKLILNSIPDVIFYKDRSGVYTGCNTALAAFFGKNPSDIIGKTDRELFSLDPELAQKFIDTDKEIFANPQKINVIEEEIVRHDGVPVMLETFKTVYGDDEGNIFGLLGISRDISLRKATEKALMLASEKAFEASQAKSEFLARMSHEIRTPLNAIIGMTYLLGHISYEKKQLEYLHKIDISAKNLLAILNDILDYSKIEAGKLAIENMSFDIDALLNEVVAIHESKATALQLQFLLHIDATIHKKVLGDRLRITQVLLNLVSNALKFTHQGSVSIHVRLESEDASAQTCIFSVADTGIGMTPAQCERLFSAFTQADGTITRKYGGTGLGLAISKMLIELMGGEIWVQSALDIGTQFFFRLRLTKDTATHTEDTLSALPQLQEARTTEPLFQDKTVLLVEDNEINQEIALEVLKMFGLHVDLAENGEVALAMCADKVYDLVLMDVQMPVMDGYTATRLLRDDLRYKYVPIIAMTANALTADRMECLNAGMNDHLPKPFDPLQLRQTLQKWLEMPAVASA